MEITKELVDKYGKAGAILSIEPRCLADEFENEIRKHGVIFCCEWFGHSKYSDFTKETIKILLERSGSYDEG